MIIDIEFDGILKVIENHSGYSKIFVFDDPESLQKYIQEYQEKGSIEFEIVNHGDFSNAIGFKQEV